jgi:signal transduction histidine kinase
MEPNGGKPKGERSLATLERMRFGPHEERADRVSSDGGTARGIESGDRVTTLQKRAARLQHSMNNPLAALLAEGQLLSMEQALTAEQRESVDRMIELTRRVIALVREMDELRGAHPPR